MIKDSLNKFIKEKLNEILSKNQLREVITSHRLSRIISIIRIFSYKRKSVVFF